jgi:hypothetical protein
MTAGPILALSGGDEANSKAVGKYPIENEKTAIADLEVAQAGAARASGG